MYLLVCVRTKLVASWENEGAREMEWRWRVERTWGLEKSHQQALRVRVSNRHSIGAARQRKLPEFKRSNASGRYNKYSA